MNSRVYIIDEKMGAWCGPVVVRTKKRILARAKLRDGDEVLVTCVPETVWDEGDYVRPHWKKVRINEIATGMSL